MAELLIKKCSGPMGWYSSLVGQTDPYLGDVGWGVHGDDHRL